MRKRTISRRAVALLAASLMAAGMPAGTVTADERPTLDAAGVEAVLRHLGYRDIERVQRRGGLFLADVSAPQGQRLRVVVDAFSGELTGLRALDSTQPRRAEPIRTSSN
ncbi:hypothetical protein [Alsobacter sp. R-9]